MRRCIGLDVHREFAQVAVWEGGQVRQVGRIGTTPEALRLFADSLGPSDEVAIEATCNTHAIAKLLAPRVARVVVSNPQKTRAIAEAKVKTDKGRRRGAGLAAGGRLPAGRVAAGRRHARAAAPGRAPRPHRAPAHAAEEPGAVDPAPQPGAALPGRRPVRAQGAGWLSEQELPADERQAVAALLRQLDFHGEELRLIDAELGRVALRSDEVRRLMTIPGVDATVALSIVAAVGDFARFRSPPKLVSYLGLNPRVRQSGGQPASHGRITKQGRAHARGMLVEAAWVAAKIPGSAARLLRARPRPPRHAGGGRGDGPQAGRALLAPDRARRGLRLPAPLADRQEAARARAARRDALRRGQKGKAAAYSLKQVRRRERELAEQAEQAYRQLVADWQAKAPARKTGSPAGSVGR
jgi:transposase